MRSKLFSMQLFVLAMALICCSFPSYGQDSATDSSKNQVKADTTTLAKKNRAQTQAGVTATPRHSESDGNYIGTV